MPPGPIPTSLTTSGLAHGQVQPQPGLVTFMALGLTSKPIPGRPSGHPSQGDPKKAPTLSFRPGIHGRG